jgi:hypothetical protein
MINRSDNLLITADSCVYDQNNEGQLTHKVFSLSGQELDELYSILQKDHFDKIRSENEDVTDRGGVTISLSWNKGQQKTEVDDMGTTSVLREHQKDWQQICNYIGRLLKNKTKLEPFTYYPEN